MSTERKIVDPHKFPFRPKILDQPPMTKPSPPESLRDYNRGIDQAKVDLARAREVMWNSLFHPLSPESK